MYIDTDITMAVIGLDKTLLEKLQDDKLHDLRTSIMTIFEINDILLETDSDLKIEEIFNMVKSKNIELLPLTPEILKISLKLLNKYNDLVLFDLKHAIHAAHCIDHKETILSTDSLFKKMEEIKCKNPIRFKNQENSFLIRED